MQTVNQKMESATLVVAWIQMRTTMTLELLMTMAIALTSVVPMHPLVTTTLQPIRMMRHAGMQSLVMIATEFA